MNNVVQLKPMHRQITDAVREAGDGGMRIRDLVSSLQKLGIEEEVTRRCMQLLIQNRRLLLNDELKLVVGKV